jgi:hypothetical protein
MFTLVSYCALTESIGGSRENAESCTKKLVGLHEDDRRDAGRHVRRGLQPDDLPGVSLDLLSGAYEMTKRVLTKPRYGWGYRRWVPVFDALLAAMFVLCSAWGVSLLYSTVNMIAEMLHLY